MIESMNGVYRSHGTWTLPEDYLLVKMLERGDSYHRISQLLIGRTEGACQQRKSVLKADHMLSSQKLEEQLIVEGFDIPQVPDFSAMLGVKNRDPEFVEFELGGMRQKLAKGSEVSLSYDGLIIEIKIY